MNNTEHIYEFNVEILHIEWQVQLPMIKMILTLNDQKSIELVGNKEDILSLKKQLDGKLFYINFLEIHQNNQPNNKEEYKNSYDLLNNQSIYYKVIKRNQFNENEWQQYIQHLLKINIILLEKPHNNIGLATEFYKDQDHLILTYNINFNEIILSRKQHWGEQGKQYNIHYISQLFIGINHLHKNGILVRNLNLSHIGLIGNQIIIIGQEFYALIDEQIPLNRCGTPGYIPPELLKDENHSIYSDLFTLGVVIHYILSGQHIYQGNVMISNFNNHQIRSELFLPWLVQLLNEDAQSRGSIDYYLNKYLYYEE